MKQIALDLAMTPAATLEDFLPGPNVQALQHIRKICSAETEVFAPTYIWGPSGVGKSHLLHALHHELRMRGARVAWLHAGSSPCQPYDEDWAAVIMDDVHLYDAHLQHLAFGFFVQSAACGCPVVAAGSTPPADLPLREDLRSRLGWGEVFVLQTLPDEDKFQVLARAASRRGLRIADEVLAYLLLRFSRNLGDLMALLERLDHYALQTQRVVTIPLLKSMLLEEQPS